VRIGGGFVRLRVAEGDTAKADRRKASLEGGEDGRGDGWVVVLCDGDGRKKEGNSVESVEVEVRCRGRLWFGVARESPSVWPGGEKMIFGGGTVGRGQGEDLG
jgi:hypothetical protein